MYENIFGFYKERDVLYFVWLLDVGYFFWYVCGFGVYFWVYCD